MPRELLSAEADDLPGLGVHPALVAAVAERCAAMNVIEGVALLGPPEWGATPALMVLARKVGAALRDDNIRLREAGGDLARGRKKLCYLPGSTVREALATEAGHRALHVEEAVFLQDLDAVWTGDGAAQPEASTLASTLAAMLAAMLAERCRRQLRTFVSADPAGLPPNVLHALTNTMDVIRIGGPFRPSEAGSSV